MKSKQDFTNENISPSRIVNFLIEQFDCGTKHLQSKYSCQQYQQQQDLKENQRKQHGILEKSWMKY